jgi:hypothetical protein
LKFKGGRAGLDAQLREFESERRASPVGEQRHGVDTLRVQHPERLHVIVERVPDDDRLSVDEHVEVVPDVRKPLRRFCVIFYPDAGEARVEVSVALVSAAPATRV